MENKKAWYRLQEDIRSHFESLGATARTNFRIRGARTFHDIDVYVEIKYLGEDINWIIEVKHWKAKISKLHVLALRSIVEDTGADRGFLISLKGFQKGAHEAALNTNVKLKTFDEFKHETKAYLESEILKTYYERLQLLEDRYWSHSKKVRIKYGLRNDSLSFGEPVKGHQVLSVARVAILNSQERRYPIEIYKYFIDCEGELIIDSFQQLVLWLNVNLNRFDELLYKAEMEMLKNGEFNPVFEKYSIDGVSICALTANAMTGKLKI